MDRDLSQASLNIETLISETAKESSVRKNKQDIHITRQSTILAIGAVGIFASYSGVSNLQSTLNIEESIGTTSLALCFVTSILASATIAPILLERAGAKSLLIGSEATFVFFSLANVYPTRYTLYPAAILLGLGESCIWPALITFNTSFASAAIVLTAEKPSEKDHRRLVEKRIRWFSGRFFSIFSAYLIVGNMMAYGILKLDPTDSMNVSQIETNFTETKSFSCGSRDCYEYKDISDNSTRSSNMDVTNYTLRYILFAVYTLLQISCCALHKLCLREPTNRNNLSERSGKREKKSRLLDVIPGFIRQATTPKQILILPLTIYNGMMMGFIFGDFTRSYIACPLSVHEIGLLMTLFGITSALSSLGYQYASAKVSKNVCIAFALTIEAIILVWCFLWDASESSNWEIYAVAAFMGVGDAVREATMIAIYPCYFGDSDSVALNFLPMLTAAGMATMYGIGTALCQITKLIILSVALACSITCYCILEIWYSH